jgi:ribosomal protein L37AE/L43A
MTCFDDIPEDSELSFPCPQCRGVVHRSIVTGDWECMDCDFKKEQSE